jgi:hypothetical protein
MSGGCIWATGDAVERPQAASRTGESDSVYQPTLRPPSTAMI